MKIFILTAVHSSIIRVSVSTSTINESRERTLKDSEVVVTATVEVIHFHREIISAIARELYLETD